MLQTEGQYLYLSLYFYNELYVYIYVRGVIMCVANRGSVSRAAGARSEGGKDKDKVTVDLGSVRL